MDSFFNGLSKKEEGMFGLAVVFGVIAALTITAIWLSLGMWIASSWGFWVAVLVLSILNAVTKGIWKILTND